MENKEDGPSGQIPWEYCTAVLLGEIWSHLQRQFSWIGKIGNEPSKNSARDVKRQKNGVVSGIKGIYFIHVLAGLHQCMVILFMCLLVYINSWLCCF